LAKRQGARAFLLDGPDGLELSWFTGARAIGVTAGASAPEAVVQGVIAQLRAWGAEGAEELAGTPETITFSLPKELRMVAVDG
jgi:4-hydroxy-3-methylbut-2-enyl diphosphate reductase